MSVKKRTKVSRHHGTHTHGRGAKKKARGSGHRGGVGMAGTGKRGDQKKTLILKIKNYFGKTIPRGQLPKRELISINLGQISPDKTDLIGYKILSMGELSFKGEIRASAASKLAIEKAAKSGSKIILPLSKSKTKTPDKKED